MYLICIICIPTTRICYARGCPHLLHILNIRNTECISPSFKAVKGLRIRFLIIPLTQRQLLPDRPHLKRGGYVSRLQLDLGDVEGAGLLAEAVGAAVVVAACVEPETGYQLVIIACAKRFPRD